MCVCVQCFPHDKRKEGDLADAQSVKLYLGAWCMCISHLKSRYAETDSEQFLLDLCYALCLVIDFWPSEGGSAPLSPFRGNTVCVC